MSENDSSRKIGIGSAREIPAVKSYLLKHGFVERSLFKFVIERERGKYKEDVAEVDFDREKGTPKCSSLDYAPNEDEVKEIEAAWGNYRFPEIVHPFGFDPKGCESLEKADKRDLFFFYDGEGRVICVQQRIEPKDGGRKVYIIWTWWSDGKWRAMEPPGFLPFWNGHLLKPGRYHTVVMHEGAKAARAAHELATPETFADKDRLREHPWRGFLEHHPHLGWIGGALSPRRSEWKLLPKMGVEQVILVADNDRDGKQAVKKIARILRFYKIKVKVFILDSRFPLSWDFADPLPEKLFTTINGRRVYTGEPWPHYMRTISWLTKEKASAARPGPGRPAKIEYELTDAANDWYVIKSEAGKPAYAHVDDLSFLMNEEAANAAMDMCSEVDDTARRIRKANAEWLDGVAYMPGSDEEIITRGRRRMLNAWVPSGISAKEGSAWPLGRFLVHLFPKRIERRKSIRWAATLIVRPEIRMAYGVLLYSKQTGTGKSTFIELLALLVGMHNASITTASEIENRNYNDWIAFKTLIGVHEIYAGKSWAVSNYLKDKITETGLRMNKRYFSGVHIDIHAHFIAGTNSSLALKMDPNDRRWFSPTVREKRFPRKKAAALRDWFFADGRSITLWHAEKFVRKYHAVARGEHAPMTTRKAEMIDDSRGDGERLVKALAAAAKTHVGSDRGLAFTDKAVVAWLKPQVKEGWQLTETEVRELLHREGFRITDRIGRLKVDGKLVYVCALFGTDHDPPRNNSELRPYIIKPEGVLPPGM